MEVVEFPGYGKLIHGDCLEVLPTLESGSVDAVITDPPYGIGVTRHHGRTGERIHLRYEVIEGDESQEVGLQVLGWAESMALPTVAFASPRLQWPGEWSSLLVWDKGGAVGGGGDVTRCWKQTWELVQVARIDRLREGRDSAVLNCHVLPELSAKHPAAKPVGLIRYFVRQVTDEGNTVFDPFMGSGTTCVAAAMEGRKFIGIEKERRYFDIAVERVTHCISPGMFAGVE